jgi:hypothetical protein
MAGNPLPDVGGHVYRSAIPCFTALRVSLDLRGGNFVGPQIFSISRISRGSQNIFCNKKKHTIRVVEKSVTVI